MAQDTNTNPYRKLPIAKQEDVQYETEFADADDREALERAEEADTRQGGE